MGSIFGYHRRFPRIFSTFLQNNQKNPPKNPKFRFFSTILCPFPVRVPPYFGSPIFHGATRNCAPPPNNTPITLVPPNFWSPSPSPSFRVPPPKIQCPPPLNFGVFAPIFTPPSPIWLLLPQILMPPPQYLGSPIQTWGSSPQNSVRPPPLWAPHALQCTL